MFPYFNKILATCRKDPAVQKYKLFKIHFLQLIQKYLDYGRVDDAAFEELGFPIDVDECGTLVRRIETITQESRQRVKISTHAHQAKLRAERPDNLKSKIQRKRYYHMSFLEARVSDNKNQEDNIRKLMKQDGLDETYFAYFLHEVLEKIKSNELKIFIVARKQDVYKSKLPKKGKLDDATYGDKNLISFDFECRKIKCNVDENLRDATAEKLDSEEDELILFYLKMHLEGNK